MPVAKVKGELEIYYEEAGSGPRSLVILGVDGDLARDVSARLAGDGVRVLRYDPRGSGRTGGDPSVTTGQHSADLAAFLRAMKVAKPTLLAVGDHAPPAVAYASRNQRDIRQLILVAPVLAPADETKLGKVGERALVLLQPDADKVVAAVL